MNRQHIRLIIYGLALVAVWLFYRYRQPRYGSGQQAPHVAAQMIDGNISRLSDLRGQYVLVQFWGSWCGPCRAENRFLAPMYQKYHARGFEIFSIGIEEDEAAWKRAIVQDGLVWKYHTKESGQFKGQLAREFNVHKIPSTFLLNPNGLITGVNLSPQQLDKILSEQLGQPLTN